jgi:uncharacterized protein
LTNRENSSHTNRLANESSPYLLLHAGNPVDWFPWGEEAFEKARSENKPIFLSIGYSTCYWCHVMEREVFTDETIASQMNAGFVNIKLDREERPDLDEVYMTATQLLTRSGGWPNSLFLTHDLAPFFAGTYFPPHDMRGRPGFPRILQSVREAWLFRRAGVEEQSRVLAQAIRDHLAPVAVAAGSDPDPEAADRLFTALSRRFDEENGGFGAAPKFPSPSNLFFLLDRAHDGDAESKRMLIATLDRMARGGIHDQLAGGFHRYSTDAEWLVPHFEKMLYDNAALARLYAEASILAPDGEFASISRRTLDFVLDEMTNTEGAFLSAIDAETEGHEGAYYVFTREELRDALGPDDALAAAVYGFDGSPNFETEHYVLHLPVPLADRAREMGIPVAELQDRLGAIRMRLLERRRKRERPATDDKVMTDWNGLTIAAMARAGSLLDETPYVDAAERAATFVLDKLKGPTGTLQHTHRAGQSRIDALLDDYAFFIDALIELHAAASHQRFLDEALRLQAEQDARLWDDKGGAYFAAGEDPRTLVRAKPGTDGAGASGTGVSALNLARLTEATGDRRHLDRAASLLRSFAPVVNEMPIAHVTLVRAMRAVAQAEALAPAGGSGMDVAPPPTIRIEASLEATALAVVEARGKMTGTSDWRTFTIDLAIRSGWHVNANPASADFLVPTSIGGDVRNVRYPEADRLMPQFTSEAIAVYSGYVTIEGDVKAAVDVPTTITLTYQACDEGRCLAAITKDVVLR